MFLGMFLMFFITTGGYGFLAYLAFRRVAAHLRNNPEGMKMVTQHVLMPLLGRKPEKPKGRIFWEED